MVVLLQLAGCTDETLSVEAARSQAAVDVSQSANPSQNTYDVAANDATSFITDDAAVMSQATDAAGIDVVNQFSDDAGVVYEDTIDDDGSFGPLELIEEDVGDDGSFGPLELIEEDVGDDGSINTLGVSEVAIDDVLPDEGTLEGLQHEDLLGDVSASHTDSDLMAVFSNDVQTIVPIEIDPSVLNVVMRPAGSEVLSNRNANRFFDQQEFEMLCFVPESYDAGQFDVNMEVSVANQGNFLGESALSAEISLESPSSFFVETVASYQNVYGEFHRFWQESLDPAELILNATCSLSTLNDDGDFEVTDEAHSTVTILQNTPPTIVSSEFVSEYGGQVYDSSIYLCSLPDCDFGFTQNLIIADAESHPAILKIKSESGKNCDLQTELDTAVDTAKIGAPISVSISSLFSIDEAISELESLDSSEPFYRRLTAEVSDNFGLGGAARKHDSAFSPLEIFACPEGTIATPRDTSGEVKSCSNRVVCL